MRFIFMAGLSLILFGGSFCLQAQPNWQIWNTANSTLPSNSVKALVTDLAGNLWIGTENGLARYNGSTFTVFTTANSALPDNDIRALAADSGGLWIGTFTGGLVRGTGNSFTVYNTNNSGLPENQIRDLKTDALGALWIATTGGLAKFQNGQFTVWNTANSGITSNNITAIALAADGSRYLATINGGLLHQTDSSVQVFNYLNSQLPDNSALALAFTGTAQLLIGTTTAGLAVLHSDTVFQTYSPQNSGNLTYTVTALAADGLGNWFLGSDLAGLVVKSGSGWSSYHTQNSGIPANQVQALLLQADGLLWVGTRSGGLAKLTYPVVSSATDLEMRQVQFFPNPASADKPIWLSPKGNYSRISVRNSTGRVVLDLPLPENTEALPALGLPAGLYLIQLFSKDEVSVGKLVIF